MENSNLIRLKKVYDELFSKGFDLNQPMQWNFYFLSKEKTLLDKVIEELKGFEYSFIINKKDNYYRLIASKTEVLAPEKLNNRITAFHELAEFVGIDSFDGWDVEYAS